MKATKGALWALVLTLAFIVSTMNASMAAITAMCKVSLDPITWVEAYDNTPGNTLSVSTGPNDIFMSWKVSNEGEFFTLNSVTIDITNANGDTVLNKKYSNYLIGAQWNQLGTYGTNSYIVGPMNQGQILYGLAILDSNNPYSFFLEVGGAYDVMMTFDVAGQNPVISTATISASSIPEPASNLSFILTCSLLLLRRERK